MNILTKCKLIVKEEEKWCHSTLKNPISKSPKEFLIS